MDRELVETLRESGRRVLADLLPRQRLRRVLEQERERHDPELWQTAGELGWPGIVVPEAFGGLGAGIEEAAAIQEELGRCLGTIPFLPSTLLARAVAAWPAEDIRAQYLPELAKGGLIGGIGFDLPGVPPVQVGMGFRLTGRAAAVLEGAIADIMLLPVLANGQEGLALVERADGLNAEALPVADFSRGTAAVHLDDVALPSARLITGPAAAALAARLADEARLLIAADSVGGAETILAMTIEYLKIRVQFGKPIGSFQALKHRCANHKLALEAARRLYGKALSTWGGGAAAKWTGIAKFAACDTYAAIAADAIQLHGGIGFTWEHDAHLFLKRALFNTYLFGDSAQMQDRTASLLLDEA